MPRKGLSQIDVTEFERSSLDHVLKKDKRKIDDTKYVSVEDALKGKAIYKVKSDRDVTRVLFISQDESLLNPEQQTLDGYTNISDLFDEVHILILRQGIKAKSPVLRVAENVWLYIASDKNWWWTPKKGMDMAEAQLSFAGGFRPDMIVARDPFESAVLAIWLSRKYNRPVQIHVLEDFTRLAFLDKNPHNKWRRRLPQFTIPRVSSVRTSTKALNDLMVNNFAIKDLSVLPRLNNYEPLIHTPKTIDLKEKYKPFEFVMLYVGKLTFKSNFYRAIDAARFGLRNPKIGLVVIGDGPAKKEFMKRAEILRVKEQVVFESNVIDVIPYLKSADVLIVPDTNPDSEELVLKAAAVGIPMVMARTPVREDTFIDNESALLCEKDNTDEYSIKLNLLVSGDGLKKHLVETAQKMIKQKFHEDPAEYMRDFRESIEQVLFVDEEEEAIIKDEGGVEVKQGVQEKEIDDNNEAVKIKEVNKN